MDLEVTQDVIHTTNDGEEVVADVVSTHIGDCIVENIVFVKNNVVFYETTVYDKGADRVVLRTDLRILQTID